MFQAMASVIADSRSPMVLSPLGSLDIILQSMSKAGASGEIWPEQMQQSGLFAALMGNILFGEVSSTLACRCEIRLYHFSPFDLNYTATLSPPLSGSRNHPNLFCSGTCEVASRFASLGLWSPVEVFSATFGRASGLPGRPFGCFRANSCLDLQQVDLDIRDQI